MFGRIQKTTGLVVISMMLASQVVAQTPVEAPANQQPVINPKLAPLVEISCPGFDKMVDGYQQRFQSKMLAWSEKNLSKPVYQTAFYPFSGPDVVTVMSIYPKANYYVMMADQFPEYALLDQPEKANPAAQNFECGMLANFSRRGYYRTNDLNGKDGPKPRFIKLLIYNIAFSGSKIEDIKPIYVDKSGLILPVDAKQQPDGVRFLLKAKDGRSVTLDYLRADLSNSGFDKRPEFTNAIARKGSQVVLLKSASHLLQNPRFSKMSDTLISNAKWVTQDETGLDITPFSNNYNLELYGKFVAAHPLWAKNESAQRLAKYFSSHPSKEDLPFILGYEKQGGSILMVGERK
jgi:hypothetical protein